MKFGRFPDPAELATIRPLADVERETIEVALRITRGDVALAARLLKIGKATIYRRLYVWGTTSDAYVRRKPPAPEPDA